MASDPAAAQELLEHAAWARRVARAMVRDEHLAEDLAQDALEAGLRRSAPPRAGIRAWLHGTLRNLSRQEARTGGRRRERELRASSAERPTSTPDELLEKVEAQRAISEAVIRLPEATRSALILRYYDELPVRYVARALRISEKAVESRLHRGLQQLRESFRARHGASWTMVVAPLLEPSAAAASSTLAGTLLMAAKTKYLVAGACALALLGGFAAVQILGPDPDAPPTADVATTGAGPAAAADHVSGESAGTHAGVPSSGEALSREPARAGLWVRVVDDAGRPVPQAEIQGLSLPAGSKPKAANFWGPVERDLDYRSPDLLATTDAEGRACLQKEAADFAGVLFVRAFGRTWQVFVVEERTASFRDLGDLALPRGGHLAFRMLDTSGRPIPGVRLSFHCKRMALDATHLRFQSALSGADGIVSFDSLPPGMGSVVCNTPGFLHWQQLDLTVNDRPGPPTEVVLDAGGSATLLVVDAAGDRVPGAEVFLHQGRRMEPALSMPRTHQEFFGDTGADGELLVRGIPPAGVVHVLARHGSRWAETTIRASETPVRLVLPRLWTLQGRVVHQGGRAEDGGQLMLVSAVNPAVLPERTQDLGPDGAFRLELQEGSYGFAVKHPSGSLMLPQEIALTRDLDLGVLEIQAGPTVSIRCLDAVTELPVEGVSISPAPSGFQSGAPDEAWRQAVRALIGGAHRFLPEEGAWVGRHLGQGTHLLIVTAAGYVRQELSLELGTEPVERVVMLEPEARLTLEVLDGDGAPLVAETIELSPEGYDHTWRMVKDPIPPKAHPTNQQTDEAGVVRFQGLPAGKWNVGFFGRASGGQSLAVLELKPGDNAHRIRLPKPVQLQIEVLCNGSPVPGARIRFRRAVESTGSRHYDGYESGGFSVETDEAGRAVFECKEPGEHRIQVFAAGLLPLQREVVLEGDSQLLKLDLDGAEIRGRVAGGSDETDVVLYQFLGDRGGSEADRISSLRGQFRDARSRNYVAHSSHMRFGYATVPGDGEFRLSGVSPGTYYLFARSDGWLMSEVQRIEVGQESLAGFTLTLQPAATIVVELTGVPEFRAKRPGVELRVEYYLGSGRFEGAPFRMERNGECRIGQCPAGDGSVVIITYDEAGAGWQEVARIPHPAVAGQETRLSWDARSLLPAEEKPK